LTDDPLLWKYAGSTWSSRSVWFLNPIAIFPPAVLVICSRHFLSSSAVAGISKASEGPPVVLADFVAAILAISSGMCRNELVTEAAVCESARVRWVVYDDTNNSSTTQTMTSNGRTSPLPLGPTRLPLGLVADAESRVGVVSTGSVENVRVPDADANAREAAVNDTTTSANAADVVASGAVNNDGETPAVAVAANDIVSGTSGADGVSDVRGESVVADASGVDVVVSDAKGPESVAATGMETNGICS